MALVYFLISDFLGNKKRGARTHSATCLLCLFKVNSFHPFEACVYGDRLGSQALFHMGHNTDFFFFFLFYFQVALTHFWAWVVLARVLTMLVGEQM